MTLIEDGLDLRRRLEPICDLPAVVFNARSVDDPDRSEDADLVLVRRERLRPPLETSIKRLRAAADQPDVVVLREEEDAVDRAQLLAAGCIAVLNLRLPDEMLCAALASLVERRARTRSFELTGGGPEPPVYADIRSEGMREVLELARKVASSDTSTFILGETGVGKEWLARHVHRLSARSRQPFVAVNCAALPKHLLESELFGHEKGAFTGAERARRGYFEIAHGGTLFLDEIGEMPHEFQSKLLRVLQDRSFRRVGGERELHVDVRIMAATNRAVSDLRSDLYFRIAVVELHVPPLRERREEIPLLAQLFLARFARQCQRPARQFDGSALADLSSYSWPGNVRELMNIMERTALLSETEVVTAADLPASVRGSSDAKPAPPRDAGKLPNGWLERPLREVRQSAAADAERMWLEAHLRDCRGRVSEVARRAGIDPRSLFDKMRSHGLRKEHYR